MSGLLSWGGTAAIFMEAVDADDSGFGWFKAICCCSCSAGLFWLLAIVVLLGIPIAVNGRRITASAFLRLVAEDTLELGAAAKDGFL